jgi:hypothetical protein
MSEETDMKPSKSEGGFTATCGSGVARIAAERRRQIEVEGWTADHDDDHTEGEMAAAAACYANVTVQYLRGLGIDLPPVGFPGAWMVARWWKPSTDPIRNLERAGALIAAEIDRLERARCTELS